MKKFKGLKGKKGALYSTLIISSLLLLFTALLVAFMNKQNTHKEHFCDSGVCVI